MSNVRSEIKLPLKPFDKLRIKREFSAGGVVYKMQMANGKWHIVWLVGKHSGYHKWVLPKGLIEEGEKGVETAVRETREEMGVVARVVDPKPIHKEEYWFVAEFKTNGKGKKTDVKDEKREMNNVNSGEKEPERRVAVYKEDPKFEESGGQKYRVLKTVSFYLMEYESGDPAEHDWEMSEAGWFGYDEAIKLLGFEGEREALEKASELISKYK